MDQLPKVVAIGFNKCATRSFARLFHASGHPVIHQKLSRLSRPFGIRKLGRIMQENQASGRAIFSGVEGYTFYGDLIYSTPTQTFDGNSLFREILNDYPGTILLLNMRNKNDWIRSRLLHGHGEFAARELRARSCSSEAELIAQWSYEWDEHVQKVRTHMQNYPMQLIEYDLDHNEIGDLVEKLPAYCLKPSEFLDIGRTRGKQVPRLTKLIKRWVSFQRPRSFD